jgi:hypothetical protein
MKKQLKLKQPFSTEITQFTHWQNFLKEKRFALPDETGEMSETDETCETCENGENGKTGETI